MHLGLYRDDLDVLDRHYPSTPADQSEPGSVLAQKHPLVRYYAAYCKQKLGADAEQNWQAAAELSANFVFPSTDMDRVVLQAALAVNGKDATAHYLLGTLLFSKGLTDEGMANWAEVKQLAPHLQVVDVDMGNALLKVKGNQQAALAAFREAARNDAENPEGYVGLDEAMSATGAPAVERAAVLSQYPSADAPDSRMPANLVYQLALTRAEAAQFEKALALFKNRFFASEEGGTTSGQVLFEVKLMQAEASAQAKNCAEADKLLGDLQPEMGLDGGSAREYLKLAGIARSCGRTKQSEDFLHRAAAGVEGADLVWAIKAQKILGTYDSVKANQRLTESLAEAEGSLAASSHSGYWQYTVAMLQAALNQKEKARDSFEKALILADNHMSHHLAREALAELSAGRLSGL